MAKECRMHDLMLELALSTSEKENFCNIYDGREARGGGKMRRLSIHTSYKNIQLCTSLSQLRSLFVFVKDMTALPSGFRLLRVLYLEEVPIDKLPDELVDLFNLRLNLRGTQIKELPKSLGRLRNLETLDIRNTNVESLPSGIVKLQRLRNLITYRSAVPTTFNFFKGTQAPSDLWKLKNLQVLLSIEANGEIVKQVGNMTQLTKFGITRVRKPNMAEGVVEPVVGKLLSLLEMEASLLGGVPHEFGKIKRELESMRSFLRDADRRRHNNNGVNEWVAQVRDVAYDVEDIIDEFSYQLNSWPKRGGFSGYLLQTIHLPKHIWVKRQIAINLQIKCFISKSMLQVVEKNEFGMAKECRMHDLMLELALSTSEKENFCNIYDGREARGGGKMCRLSLHTSYKNIQLCTSLSQLRSLFVFVKDMTALPSGFRLLRVLYLEEVPIDKLPDELVDLFNLRYLNLRGTQIKELPKSLGRLRNLETLDIRNTNVESLPSGIVKLQRLRNLITYRSAVPTTFNFFKGTQAPSDLWKLKNLQVLLSIEANSEIVKQVGNMTQLTKFGITNVREGDQIELCVSISRLGLLRNLVIMVTDEEECLRIDALSSPPPLLRELFLLGKLEKVPLWFRSLQNLTYLSLNWSRLSEDPLSYIHALPNLVVLRLDNAYDGRKLWFQAGFLKLKTLYLFNFPQLKDILVEKGVMPSIRKLYLESGVDHSKVQHIPQIFWG
ncbi:hypothetical protein HHK36_020280 [Tetracentron sinense]|uniref:Uncharacterized protein n=1 Tax=Tetracentron sinense TaxID=13715 RepID=A0A834YWV9_TETSI|nr:hypothetical protein HHK36_020280 [Tetracentron sinense]